MEKEKQKKEEIKIKIEDLPKQIDQQSISSEDRVPRKRKIKLHWSYKISIWYGYVTTKFRYQLLFVNSLFQFSVWLHKLYEDIGQANEYNNSTDFIYLSISILMLILPTLMCTFYLLLTHLIDSQFVFKRKNIIVQLVNGFMLVPWQIKQCLDTLHYSAQRICDHVWSVYERKKVFNMGINCDLLEFFEDMFSGFLGISLQVYIIFVNIGWTGEETQDSKMVTGELIGSILSLLSMLEAIKRRDDGFVNASLARLGWIFMFTSRALAFCLATTVIKFWIIIFILVHAVTLNCWVFHIAQESYLDVIINDEKAIIDWRCGSKKGQVLLWLLSFVIYGIPSLIYWPLMFQMKDAGRTYTFLLIILIENICLAGIWTFGVFFYQITTITMYNLIYMNFTVLTMTLISILWIHLYMKRKPYNADKRVLLDILQKANEAQAECAVDYGVSYIFYSKVFALPTLKTLWKSVPPYCNEDRLLFTIEIDSSDNEHEKNENFFEYEPTKIQKENKVNLKEETINSNQNLHGYINYLCSDGISDADDEDESDDNSPNPLIFTRSNCRSKVSLESLSD